MHFILKGDEPTAGERQVREAVNCALDGDEDLKALREEWLVYIDATQYYRMGLQLTAEKK